MLVNESCVQCAPAETDPREVPEKLTRWLCPHSGWLGGQRSLALASPPAAPRCLLGQRAPACPSVTARWEILGCHPWHWFSRPGMTRKQRKHPPFLLGPLPAVGSMPPHPQRAWPPSRLWPPGRPGWPDMPASASESLVG